MTALVNSINNAQMDGLSVTWPHENMTSVAGGICLPTLNLTGKCHSFKNTVRVELLKYKDLYPNALDCSEIL